MKWIKEEHTCYNEWTLVDHLGNKLVTIGWREDSYWGRNYYVYGCGILGDLFSRLNHFKDIRSCKKFVESTIKEWKDKL